MKKYDLLAASAIVLLHAGPVAAQTAQPLAESPTQRDSADVADKTGDTPTIDDIGRDIVVTATKRETTLLDTPISVSVTSGGTIRQAQIRDLLDLQSVVPSLRVNQLQSSANTNFIIRGFGNGANNAGIEPSVGVFIDGVYRSRSAAQIADLPNLKRVEVLRGPQSTLFGKNASAGIISIVTAEPAFDFGGSAEATYGDYDAVVLKGDVTGPISDTLAFSLAVNYNRRDGYARDLKLDRQVNGRDRYGVRGQLLFQPSADLKFRLIGDYDNIDENCCVAGNIVNGPTGAILNALTGNRAIDAANPFSYKIYNNFLSSNRIKNYGGSLQSDYRIGDVSLTSITAYREVRADTNQDSDFTGADLIGRNSQNLAVNTVTQEVRLASDFDGPLNFLLGGFYFNEKIRQWNQLLLGTQFRPYGDQLIRAATGGALNVATLEGTFGALEGAPTRYLDTFFRAGDGLSEAYRLDDESGSIFGTVDFKVTDRLTLTGGLNYTADRKNFATAALSSDVFSSINLDAPQYAPFRNQLILGGALAAAGVSTASQAAIVAFATNPATAATYAGFVAFANANQNNPAANPLAALKVFQFLPPFLNIPNSVEPAKTSDNNLSYTLRAAYKVSNNLNVYAVYATGFKASSVNLSRDSRPTPADLIRIRAAGFAVANLSSGSRYAGPEKSKVYEAGIKGQFSRAAFNIAIFKQEITGFQSNVFTGTGFTLFNAPKQSTFGVEFDGSVTPLRNLTLNGAVTYLDPKYDSFPVGGAITDPNLTVNTVNLSGTRPAGIPEFAASIGATFTQDITDSAKLLLRGDFQYETPVQIAEGVVALEREVKQLNLAATLQLDKGLEFSVWGRNVTDDQFITTIFPSVAQSGSISGYPNQPRTYGGTVRFTF